MDDKQKIEELQAALKLAMKYWAAYLDDEHGIHPSESSERKDWLRCEALSVAWTNQALGGIGG